MNFVLYKLGDSKKNKLNRAKKENKETNKKPSKPRTKKETDKKPSKPRAKKETNKKPVKTFSNVRKEKKYKFKIVYFFEDKPKKTIKFGDAKYEDYTIHKNKIRKQDYIERHKTRENWEDPMTKGFWARWLLWNKTTIKKSIQNILKKFPGITIKYVK